MNGGPFLQVEVRFTCFDIVGPLRNGVYDIPENGKISDLLEISRAGCQSQASENMPDYLIFLRNGKPAQLDTELFSGDKVHVLRKIMGG